MFTHRICCVSLMFIGFTKLGKSGAQVLLQTSFCFQVRDFNLFFSSQQKRIFFLTKTTLAVIACLIHLLVVWEQLCFRKVHYTMHRIATMAYPMKPGKKHILLSLTLTLTLHLFLTLTLILAFYFRFVKGVILYSSTSAIIFLGLTAFLMCPLKVIWI